MSYKLIALDIDGTLLNSKKEITPKTLEAINKAINDGIEIIISSGRCLPELTDILEQIPNIRYLIMTSGAMVYDFKDKKEIYSNQLSIDMIQTILTVSKERDMLVHLLTDQSIVEKDKGHRLVDYGMGVYQPMYNAIATFVDDIYDHFNQINKPLEKLNLYHRTVEDREHSLSKLKDLDISLKYAEGTSLECSALNINKGTGLQKLCEYLNIDIQDTIAIGDADNDLEILEVAGLSVAMGNASNHIKELADVITLDNDHDGIAKIIEEYIYENK